MSGKGFTRSLVQLTNSFWLMQPHIKRQAIKSSCIFEKIDTYYG